MKPKHEIQRTHMSIGPSDRSEEAHLLMTINRHQTGNDMRERAVKVPLHLHRNPRPHGINSQMLPLQEQAQTFTQGTHDTPRNEQEHIPHTGEFCWAYMHTHICKKVNPDIYFNILFYFSIKLFVLLFAYAFIFLYIFQIFSDFIILTKAVSTFNTTLLICFRLDAMFPCIMWNQIPKGHL